MPIACAVTLGAASLAGAVLSRPGAHICHQVYEFLEYYSGVFSLVAQSITVMGGIAATERTVLKPHHRVQLQVVHRAMAALAVGFLAVHIASKVIESHARAIDAAVPFLAEHQRGYVGLGTVAAYLMVIAMWTGLARSRFAGSLRVWSWRLLHSVAYVAWPVALAHGLESGRSAKTWVWVSYTLCLILVAVAMTVRLAAALARRASGPRARTTGEIRATRRSRDALAAVDEWPSGPLPPMPTEPAPALPPTEPAPAFPPGGRHTAEFAAATPAGTGVGGVPVSPAGTRVGGVPVSPAGTRVGAVPVSPAPRPRRPAGPGASTPRRGQRALGEHAGPAHGPVRRREHPRGATGEAPPAVDPVSDTLSRDVSDEEFLAFLRGTGPR